MENEDGVTGAVKAFLKHLPPKKTEPESTPVQSSLFSMIRRCFGCSWISCRCSFLTCILLVQLPLPDTLNWSYGCQLSFLYWSKLADVLFYKSFSLILGLDWYLFLQNKMLKILFFLILEINVMRLLLLCNFCICLQWDWCSWMNPWKVPGFWISGVHRSGNPFPSQSDDSWGKDCMFYFLLFFSFHPSH